MKAKKRLSMKSTTIAGMAASALFWDLQGNA